MKPGAKDRLTEADIVAHAQRAARRWFFIKLALLAAALLLGWLLSR